MMREIIGTPADLIDPLQSLVFRVEASTEQEIEPTEFAKFIDITFFVMDDETEDEIYTEPIIYQWIIPIFNLNTVIGQGFIPSPFLYYPVYSTSGRLNQYTCSVHRPLRSNHELISSQPLFPKFAMALFRLS